MISTGSTRDLRLIPSVDRVEVRWVVVVEIHSNQDAKKTADLGHLPTSYHGHFRRPHGGEQIVMVESMNGQEADPRGMRALLSFA
jgi:hypothetical protein